MRRFPLIAREPARADLRNLAPPRASPLHARVVVRRPGRQPWSVGRKFTLWLADQASSLRAFARQHGFAEQSLRGWMKRGVRMPADALSRVARATSLPEAYWLDDTLPYPPPLDYLNSRERAASMLAALSPDDFIGPCNLGNQTEFTVKQLAELVIELTGSKSKIAYQPLPADDPVRRQPDITLARQHLNWQPATDLRDGLQKTIAWFRTIDLSDYRPPTPNY